MQMNVNNGCLIDIAIKEQSCKRCGEVKALSDFYIVRGSLASPCKACVRITQKEYYNKTKDSRKVANEERRRKRRYNVTASEIKQLFELQQGCCDVCNRPLSLESSRGFAVDHDHTTGEVRGLLCLRCNTGIGLLGDSAQYLTRALNYLEKHEKITYTTV